MSTLPLFFRRSPTYSHVVVDTETLSLSPVAAVMSIGAVHFDLHTGLIKSTFSVNTNAQFDVDVLGGHCSPATMDWWMKPEQSESRFLCTAGAVSGKEALLKLTSWMGEALPDLWDRPHRVCVWAMGSEFDPPILNEWAFRVLRYYQDDDLKPVRDVLKGRELLSRRALADMRLLFKLWPGEVPRPKTVAHVALDDAVAQYKTIIKYRRLGMFNGLFNQMRRLP